MASCFFIASHRPVLRVTASIYRLAQVSSPSFNTMAPKGKRPVPEPRPSASVILVSPTNQILLLHRVKTSTSFASAHVFPGGNLDALHDGDVAPPSQPEERHRDGAEYRLAALRECFEESGILLAKRKEGGEYVSVADAERDAARRRVHNHEEKFTDWVSSIGGVPDVDGLIPFTRWITPPGPPKRFTTQMYLYFLPPKSSVSSTSTSTSLPPTVPFPSTDATLTVPTPDNGVEHTAATFATAATWLHRHRDREISMFPPQYFLLTLVARFLKGDRANTIPEREELLRFLERVPTGETEAGRAHPTGMIPWADKVMSPTMWRAGGNGSVVLGLDRPGRELEKAGSKRGGDFERVVVVDFGGKEGGPWCLGVKTREEVLAEARGEEEAEPRAEKL